MVAIRRLLRRLLRPIFLHQVALFQYLIDRLDQNEKTDRALRDDVNRLGKRQDELEQRSENVLAYGWDYVAMVRRLAVLEDHLAALTGQVPGTADETDGHPSILFPGLNASHEARTKVC